MSSSYERLKDTSRNGALSGLLASAGDDLRRRGPDAAKDVVGKTLKTELAQIKRCDIGRLLFELHGINIDTVRAVLQEIDAQNACTVKDDDLLVAPQVYVNSTDGKYVCAACSQSGGATCRLLQQSDLPVLMLPNESYVFSHKDLLHNLSNKCQRCKAVLSTEYADKVRAERQYYNTHFM